ncbi:alpha-L-fucosidase-domain-containing protein [Mycena albidolilacea]|uniref:Alpha-L-fucosidase-domain-containing protein n=1 Tax=Mycena albidolilacea TaxID=1033008 RepID=A0AAD7AGH0_9AGAR|nr:alpha-L-fucosidase-domain-containing protein [Mycena albidolilacea]
MDPFSYGLNAVTNASQYKNGTTIVQTLVDIVSKNGNFLLDIGPTAEGEIIEAVMEGLLDTSAWLDYSGTCIYDTNYWFPGSQDTNPPPSAPVVRFLIIPTTFCVVAFALPANGQLPTSVPEQPQAGPSNSASALKLSPRSSSACCSSSTSSLRFPCCTSPPSSARACSMRWRCSRAAASSPQ